MTADTATAPAGGIDLRREPGIPLSTLVQVELRKMTDTRAGRWLLGIVGLIIVVVTVAFGFAADQEDLRFDEFLRAVQFPIAMILPVLGILSVTSEWSQRTALTTFTLVPHRGRVIGAKVIAVVGLVVAAMLVSAVVAVIGNAFAGGEWTFSASTVVELLAFQVGGMLMGFAFGLVVLASAPAIVLYYVLPSVWSIATSLIGAIEDPSRWLDTTRAWEPLTTGDMSGVAWARVGTSALLWVAVPLVVGLWRLRRSEVK